MPAHGSTKFRHSGQSSTGRNTPHDGELFLYVNDAVLMIPGQTELFYKNYVGLGALSVKEMQAVK